MARSRLSRGAAEPLHRVTGFSRRANYHKNAKPFPNLMGRICPRTRFSTVRLSRLQLFRHVQTSRFAPLPDRSYRSKFPCGAAEGLTSEPNVRRFLCTHRICYTPDDRQLTERGFSPHKIRGTVLCPSRLTLFTNHLDNVKGQDLRAKASE